MKPVSFLASLFVFATTISASANVWEPTNTWSEDWEQKYSAFIKNDFNEDFYTKGKWGKISTDCADAAYSARIIFSYENSLPFRIYDPTGGPKALSNKMIRFDDIQDPTERVRAFIKFINDITGTSSIPDDTYPVSINRQQIRSGTIWNRVRGTASNFFTRLTGTAEGYAGHTELVKEVKDTGAVILIGSTVPAAVRQLIVTSSLVFLPDDSSTGFRRWIWPQDYGKKVENLPGFSLEQYKMGLYQNTNNSHNDESSFGTQQQNTTYRTVDQFQKDVTTALALRDETENERRDRYILELCSLARAREEVVTQALQIKGKKSADWCMNKYQYDAFSTPGRDKRLNETLTDLLDLQSFWLFRNDAKVIDKLAGQFDACGELTIAEGQSIKIRDFLKNLVAKKVSSDPNDSLEARWGFVEQLKDNSCPTKFDKED